MSDLAPITVLKPHFAVVAHPETGELKVVRSLRSQAPGTPHRAPVLQQSVYLVPRATPPVAPTLLVVA